MVPAEAEDLWLPNVPGRSHRPPDEDDKVVAELMLVLELDEGVVAPLLLRHVRRRVRDVAVSQQVVDLQAGQPLRSVRQEFADSSSRSAGTAGSLLERDRMVPSSECLLQFGKHGNSSGRQTSSSDPQAVVTQQWHPRLAGFLLQCGHSSRIRSAPSKRAAARA